MYLNKTKKCFLISLFLLQLSIKSNRRQKFYFCFLNNKNKNTESLV